MLKHSDEWEHLDDIMQHSAFRYVWLLRMQRYRDTQREYQISAILGLILGAVMLGAAMLQVLLW